MPLTRMGKLITWKDEKGFGFIRPDLQDHEEIFVHITAIQKASRRPVAGDKIKYQIESDSRGRKRACNATLIEAGVEIDKNKLVTKILVVLPFLFAGYILWKEQNPIPLIVYLVMSPATYLLYVTDKISAIKKQWRIMENTLHLLELLGGWPGALLAQKHIHHKNRKLSYQIVFWTIVIIHIMLWVYCFIFGCFW
ncbi:cold shock and DUF1294 domain-containing protein [Candidatus Halobeggiatoa sp. HSG11]|nr:cold shock and DUF1294 domain-containing protein [Candidatus Halobeggiatoa sp. HSG11]